MKYFWVISVFFCLAFKAPAQAHADFTPELKRAFEYITQMRFSEAQKLVEREGLKDPANRVPHYLEGAMLCIGLFVNEDQQKFDRKKNRLDQIVDAIEELPEEEAYRNLFLGELYVAQAILNGKFKNNLTAAWQFYKAYDYLTTNYKKHPDFAPTYIPLGVLYSAIGSLPENYRSLASLLGFEGSVDQGIGLLSRAYRELSGNSSASFYSTYAGFVYSFVSFQLDPSSEVSPESLGLPVSSSSFLIYLQARIALDEGRPKEAAQWLDQRRKGEKYLDFHHLDYLHGKILLGLEPKEAREHLMYYITNTETELYLKSSYRYLSWYYLIEGNEEKAHEMRALVFKEGSAHAGADRQALNEAKDPFNLPLIKARVLFDAARYAEAKEILRNSPVKKCCQRAQERTEYYYRYGRIEQRQSRWEEARQNFQNALEVEGSPASYALGNSALQLALIYEKQGNKSEAKQYFKEALKYDGYSFYEGIHQKAKAGLSRLRN